jgi:uncharacterized protein YneF (UPF0154 family)
MSANHFPQINKQLMFRAAVLLLLILLVAINARMILESVLAAKGIDEEIVAEANPRLNKELLQKAVTILGKKGSEDLTSIFSTATVERQEVSGPVTIEIQNGSSVNGAAAGISRILSESGYIISDISTAPSLQTQSTVFYKQGRAEEAVQVGDMLTAEGWSVKSVQEAQDLGNDIRIVLGS